MRKQTISRDEAGSRWTLSPGWFSEHLMNATSNFGKLVNTSETITIEEFANRIKQDESMDAQLISQGLFEEMDWADTPEGQAKAKADAEAEAARETA